MWACEALAVSYIMSGLVAFGLNNLHTLNYQFVFIIILYVAFCTLIFHCYFFIAKYLHTSFVLRIIDYIYFSVSGIGVLIAVMQYSHDHTSNLKQINILWSDRLMNITESRFSSSFYAYCRGLPMPRTYSINIAKCKSLQDKLIRYENIDFLDGAHNEYNKKYALIEQMYASTVDPQNTAEHAMTDIQIGFIDSFEKEIRETELLPIDMVKNAGFVLIGCALALRVSRVSIEAFNWFRASP